MRHYLLLTLLVLTIGCGKKNQSDSQAGTASQSNYTEVISSSSGYIIQNAKIVTDKNEQPSFTLNGALKLGASNTSVMVIRGANKDNSASTLLALQIPTFSEGAMTEFDGSAASAQFILFGNVDGQAKVHESGLISGSVRFIKMTPSSLNLGLNRALMEGTGEMEVIVSNIQPSSFSYDAQKKFIARYSLPMVKLDEIMRLSLPS